MDAAADAQSRRARRDRANWNGAGESGREHRDVCAGAAVACAWGGGGGDGAARWRGERVRGGKNFRDSFDHGGAPDSSARCAESAAVKNRNRPLKTEALMKCETGAMKALSRAEIRNQT